MQGIIQDKTITTNHDLESVYPRPLSGARVTRLLPGRVPARTTLVGDDVILEPQDADKHAAALFEASHGSEEGLRIWDYLAVGPWADEKSFKAALRDQSTSLDPIFYTVCDKASGAPCGQISLMDIHPQNGTIEIGNIWFGPSLQRTRGATEALFIALAYAMDDLGYRRMQWRCNSLNVRSRNAARRLGFRFEGTFHNHLIFKGMNRDTTWYSILEDEWPEIRGILAKWLAADNFDNAGRARGSLAGMMENRAPSTRG
jgi:RimJ/RimL family protein N-acetyltransferase